MAYYVDHIAMDESFEKAQKAFNSAYEFAIGKQRKKLFDMLDELQLKYGFAKYGEGTTKMNKLSFNDFYHKFKGLVDARKSETKSSHMTAEESRAYAEWSQSQWASAAAWKGQSDLYWGTPDHKNTLDLDF